MLLRLALSNQRRSFAPVIQANLGGAAVGVRAFSAAAGFKRRRRRQADEGLSLPTFTVNSGVRDELGGKTKVRIIYGPGGSADSKEASIMTVASALHEAESSGLDLVLLAKGSKPPTCCLRDNKRHMFTLRKKALEKRKVTKAPGPKDVQFKVGIDSGDFLRQCKTAAKFLDKGHPVKVTVKLTGRVPNARNRAKELLVQLSDVVEPYSSFSQDEELAMRLTGGTVSTYFTPEAKKK